MSLYELQSLISDFTVKNGSPPAQIMCSAHVALMLAKESGLTITNMETVEGIIGKFYGIPVVINYALQDDHKVYLLPKPVDAFEIPYIQQEARHDFIAGQRVVRSQIEGQTYKVCVPGDFIVDHAKITTFDGQPTLELALNDGKTVRIAFPELIDAYAHEYDPFEKGIEDMEFTFAKGAYMNYDLLSKLTGVDMHQYDCPAESDDDISEDEFMRVLTASDGK